MARLLSSGHFVSGGRQKDNKSSAKIKALFQKPLTNGGFAIRFLAILLG
jgi:hypothetical protein